MIIIKCFVCMTTSDDKWRVKEQSAICGGKVQLVLLTSLLLSSGHSFEGHIVAYNSF